MPRSSNILATLAFFLAALSARADDADTLLKDLLNPSSRPAAVARLDKIPLTSLAKVADASFDPTTPAAVRTLIDTHLPAIYTRLRADAQKQNAADRDAWVKSALEDPYRKSPRTNTKWDALALAALVNLDRDETNFDQLQAAKDAGCNNTIIELLYDIRGLELRQVDAAKTGPALDAHLKSFDSARYPDGTKFFVRMQLLSLMNSLDWPAEFPSKLKLTDEADHTFALFPHFLEQHPDHRLLDQQVHAMWILATAITPDVTAAYEKISGLVAGPLGNDPIFKDITAWYLMDKGQKLRLPSGMASPESLALWDRATQAALEGWTADPLYAKCCMDPLNSAYDRLSPQDVDKWVRLGNLADPNSNRFCLQKLELLVYQQNNDEALAFGRECLRTGTPRNSVPLILAYARFLIGAASDDYDAYLKRPDVWADIQSAYTKILADTSRARDQRAAYLTDRTNYLGAAVYCHQWQVYLTLTQEFGDDIDLDAIGGKDLYIYSQKFAREQLTAAHIAIAPPVAQIPLPPADPMQLKTLTSDEIQTNKKPKKARGTGPALPEALQDLP